MSVERLLGLGLLVVVGVAVVVGLLVLGSPSEERSRLLDARRVEDLHALTSAIKRHHEREGALPERMEDLAELEPEWLRDPRSGEAYGYRPLAGDAFELCATFEQRADRRHWPQAREAEPFRFHDAGPQCFRIPISKG